jgi:FMN-dependent oxidoreductase (nitrilotriacetate monooxygenase family)
MRGDKKIKLGSFMTLGGECISAWRHPDILDTNGADIQGYLTFARLLEAALFDVILVADVAPSFKDPVDILSRMQGYDRLDPMVLSTALAMGTERIGIVTTLSTTYDEPYHVARKIGSLDHVASGRAGWNIVTTTNETDAQNFSRARHDAHGDRYARAEEFVDVVCGLWRSWDRDAFIRDKQSGIFFRPEGLHVLNHKGPHFSVRGPLDVRPTPQGRPVLVQAGSSEPGKALGSRVADVAFSTHQSLASAKAFRDDVRQRAVVHGRAADDLSVMMALIPVIGATEEHAKSKCEQILGLIDPVVALPQLSIYLGRIDLTQYPLDEPLPEDLPPSDGIGTTSRRGPIMELSRRENLTLRQLAQRVAGTRGHWTLVGTAAQIADQMEAWFTGGATDGFLIVPLISTSLADFAREVVPELQRRGLFRTAYEGQTLRENLGLPPC